MTTTNRLFVDVHVIQTVPPSCINRDDTGSPKTALYGGALRARVSSQSWKKAMRDMFKEIFPEKDLGLRTKKIVELVSREIMRLNSSIDAEKVAQIILKNAGLSIKSVEKGTNALFFMSHAQAEALARLAVEEPDTISETPSKVSKEKIQNALKDQPGIDVALFGRMVADNPSYNTDACSQVAHSISTHKVSNEYDYFTAVDDLSTKDNAGAAHLDTTEYNSATLYRYATVAVHELQHYMQQDTASVMKGFVKAFVLSMPTGKQNTFANRTLPNSVMVTLRTDQPVNMVGAFERPVRAGRNNDEGYIANSVNAFADHTKRTYQDWIGEPIVTLVSGIALSDLGDVQSFDLLLETLGDEIERLVPQGGGNQ